MQIILYSTRRNILQNDFAKILAKMIAKNGIDVAEIENPFERRSVGITGRRELMPENATVFSKMISANCIIRQEQALLGLQLIA